VLSGLWMPTSNLDVAGWFKWQDALKASTDLTLTSLYWNANGTPNTTPCVGAAANCNLTQANGAGTVKLQIPMEAKLGLRFHLPRKEVTDAPGWSTRPGRKVRDPMSQDIFDVEVDFTYANNSAVQNLQLGFNPGIGIKGTPSGTQVPVNGDIPYNWKDVFGVRLGGDVVAVPNVLSVRAGGFYETKGQDDQYLSLAFDLAQKLGLSAGATVRLGPVDISAAFAHTFYGTLNNGGNGKVYALSGDTSGTHSQNGQPAVCGPDPKNPAIGPGCFRSYQPINGGILTQSLNEVGLSGTVRY